MERENEGILLQKEGNKEKALGTGPSAKHIEIINNWIDSTQSYWTLLNIYGVNDAKDLTKDQASEMVAKIYKGELK